jgi:hypothetical protein
VVCRCVPPSGGRTAERGLVRLRPMTAMRSMAAAPLADGCVRELRSRPPEILFFEARVNQDVKCFSARHRLRAARVLFVADHAAYHLGQIVLVRRMLGIWPS